MGGEEVIELSVEETNKLRAELGLAPLRLSKEASEQNIPNEPHQNNTENGASQKEEEILEMSIDETNELRAKLGLKPLRTTAGNSSKTKEIIHKPAENDGESQQVKERLERAKLQRDVEDGVSKTFGSSTLADEEKEEEEESGNNKNALSWAERMRKQQKQSLESKKKSSKKKSSSSNSNNNNDTSDYGEKELEGMQVAHNLTELEAGSTTVLTIADAPILETTSGRRAVGLNEGDVALENVNLTESKKQQDGLRKKRLLELGMGRAGGYSGFDDEEFEELGGTLGPARKERGHVDYENGEEVSSKPKGFRIGSVNAEDEAMTDFDKISSGKAVSLLPTQADTVASDYMTIEEQEEERAKRKKKKDGKFKKKKKKDKKKKRSRRTAVESDDEDDADDADTNKNSGNSLLEQLEQTAKGNDDTSNLRKRRREESDDEGTNNNFKQEDSDMGQNSGPKRSRYEDVMEKSNARSKLMFQEKPKVAEPTFDEEPDDSFLNAAVEKARRLNRLREMNNARSKGAEAVADAVKSIKTEEVPSNQGAGTLTFAIDDTREFTRAIRAKSQQKEREAQRAKAKSVPPAADTPAKVEEAQEEQTVPEETKTKVEDVVSEDEDVDMEELAKEVKNDDGPGFEGSTAESVGVGRGLAGFVSMLKQTGEISAKRRNKEELRGRAKDERNYENYEAMDLSKVVKIGRHATDKDKELARREVKLEYRDSHGRLLTQKEAFRDLCYQFHGHGASKKKEEKRLKQIAREQAEARLASRQVAAARDGTAAGTLGALKATQKATGKAFVVHKT